jgi:hypothetical protein
MKKLFPIIMLVLALLIPSASNAYFEMSLESLDRDPDTYIQFSDKDFMYVENLDNVEVRYKSGNSNYDTTVMWPSQGIMRVNIFERAKRNSDIPVSIYVNGKKHGNLRLRVGRINSYNIH